MLTPTVRRRLLSHWRHRIIVLTVALLALGAATFTMAKPEAASAQVLYPGYNYNPACYSYNSVFYSYPFSYLCSLNYGYNGYYGYNPYSYNPYYYNPYVYYGFSPYYPWYPPNWWQWRR